MWDQKVYKYLSAICDALVYTSTDGVATCDQHMRYDAPVQQIHNKSK